MATSTAARGSRCVEKRLVRYTSRLILEVRLRDDGRTFEGAVRESQTTKRQRMRALQCVIVELRDIAVGDCDVTDLRVRGVVLKLNNQLGDRSDQVPLLTC